MLFVTQTRELIVQPKVFQENREHQRLAVLSSIDILARADKVQFILILRCART